jgi:hypothetical protein
MSTATSMDFGWLKSKVKCFSPLPLNLRFFMRGLCIMETKKEYKLSDVKNLGPSSRALPVIP